eukprot:gene1284-13216_t
MPWLKVQRVGLDDDFGGSIPGQRTSAPGPANPCTSLACLQERLYGIYGRAAARMKDAYVIRDIVAEGVLQKREKVQVMKENFAAVVNATSVIFVILYEKGVAVPADNPYRREKQRARRKVKELEHLIESNPGSSLGGIPQLLVAIPASLASGDRQLGQQVAA